MSWFRSKKDIKQIEELKESLLKLQSRKWKEEGHDRDYKFLWEKYCELKSEIKRDSIQYALKGGSAGMQIVKIATQIEQYLLGK
jgi:hypothetical protein